MKRRDFIVGASGAAGSLLLGSAHGGIPCPPSLDGASSSGEICPGPSGSSTLSDHASQLNPGNWLRSIPLPSDINPWDISWQNRTGFWDDVHRELQFMGKPQLSAGGGNRSPHWIYSDQTNSWRKTTQAASPGKGGHIWKVTFDHTDDPGDYYYIEQEIGSETNTIRRMDRSVENGQGQANSPWGLLTRAGFKVWEPTSTPNPGMGYHPNLLGPGRPGIFCFGTTDFSYWDKNNDEWVYVRYFGVGAPYGKRRNNTSLYVPGRDILVFGSGKYQSQQAMIIPAGYNGNGTPQLEDLPIRVESDSGGGAHMLIDPRDDGTIMLLERQGNRVWTNSQGAAGSAWRLESYTHPFWSQLPVNSNDAGSWTCCAIPRHGVVLGMASHGSASSDGQNGTIMWRPG